MGLYFSKLFGLNPDGPKGLIANVVQLATFRFRKKQLHSHSHSKMLSNEEFIYSKLCYIYIYIYIKKGWPFKKTPSFCHWWCSFDVMLVWTLSPFLASLGAHVIELTAQRVLLLPFPWAKGRLSWDYNL